MLSSGPSSCAGCRSKSIRVLRTYQTTQNGQRSLLRCDNCDLCFSETKNSVIEKLQRPISLVVQALRARLGGMGFNETAMAFGIARGTLRVWEGKFAALAKPMSLYALTHSFLKQVIEGDELYTKVGRNTAADDSAGWTVVLMDRASRFVWFQECGKKDKRLFRRAIKRLARLCIQAQDVTLVTDGERRYGNVLFEICSELVATGKQGRPKKFSAKVSKSESRTRAVKRRSADENGRNIKRLGQNIQTLFKTSAILKSKPIASKARMPRPVEETQRFDAELTRMLKTPQASNAT